jgi:molybdopterin synthase sulfur carrier subunit
MPPEQPPGALVTLRYWAAARAVAGVDSDAVAGCATVADAVAAANTLRPGLDAVTAVSSFLLEGRPAQRADPVPAGAVVEILPPFAGG